VSRCLHHPSYPSRLLSLEIALFAVASLSAWGAVPLTAQSAAEMDPLRRFNASVETLVKRVSPSVVQVTTTGYGRSGSLIVRMLVSSWASNTPSARGSSSTPAGYHHHERARGDQRTTGAGGHSYCIE